MPEEERLWRYMDFTKFVAMLEWEGVFFPRAIHLGDPFEGSFPISQPPESRLRRMLADQIPDGLEVLFDDDLLKMHAWFRNWTLISCWHGNEHESAAMWKLYAESSQAIAITSSVDRLQQAIATPAKPEGWGGGGLVVGRVEYLDYATEEIPSESVIAAFFRKLKSFEHEREVRAVIQRWPTLPNEPGLPGLGQINQGRMPDNDGEWLPADLDRLIDGVYVAPQAQLWYRDLVERVLRRYGLDREVQQSSLDRTPLY